MIVENRKKIEGGRVALVLDLNNSDAEFQSRSDNQLDKFLVGHPWLNLLEQS